MQGLVFVAITVWKVSRGRTYGWTDGNDKTIMVPRRDETNLKKSTNISDPTALSFKVSIIKQQQFLC